MALKILSGTKFTINWSGPSSLGVTSATLAVYLARNSADFSSERNFPGLVILTIKRPMLMAITVVMRYMPMVLKPMRDNRETSFSPEIPLMSEAMINGMAMSLSKLMKMVPQG